MSEGYSSFAVGIYTGYLLCFFTIFAVNYYNKSKFTRKFRNKKPILKNNPIIENNEIVISNTPPIVTPIVSPLPSQIINKPSVKEENIMEMSSPSVGRRYMSFGDLDKNKQEFLSKKADFSKKSGMSHSNLNFPKSQNSHVSETIMKMRDNFDKKLKSEVVSVSPAKFEWEPDNNIQIIEDENKT
jgi:hypothetical protein